MDRGEGGFEQIRTASGEKPEFVQTTHLILNITTPAVTQLNSKPACRVTVQLHSSIFFWPELRQLSSTQLKRERSERAARQHPNTTQPRGKRPRRASEANPTATATPTATSVPLFSVY